MSIAIDPQTRQAIIVALRTLLIRLHPAECEEVIESIHTTFDRVGLHGWPSASVMGDSTGSADASKVNVPDSQGPTEPS